jgi:hypothetical protein
MCMSIFGGGFCGAVIACIGYTKVCGNPVMWRIRLVSAGCVHMCHVTAADTGHGGRGAGATQANLTCFILFRLELGFEFFLTVNALTRVSIGMVGGYLPNLFEVRGAGAAFVASGLAWCSDIDNFLARVR